jgi:hypothetical protein
MPHSSYRTYGAIVFYSLLSTELPGRCPCGHVCRDKFTLKGEGKENSFLPLPTGKGAGGMGPGRAGMAVYAQFRIVITVMPA